MTYEPDSAPPGQFWVSLRQEERTGGRGRALLHASRRCASRLLDCDLAYAGGNPRFCRRCVK